MKFTNPFDVVFDRDGQWKSIVNSIGCNSTCGLTMQEMCEPIEGAPIEEALRGKKNPFEVVEFSKDPQKDLEVLRKWWNNCHGKNNKPFKKGLSGLEKMYWATWHGREEERKEIQGKGFMGIVYGGPKTPIDEGTLWGKEREVG